MGQKKQTTEFERKCFEAAGISIVYHICHHEIFAVEMSMTLACNDLLNGSGSNVTKIASISNVTMTIERAYGIVFHI